MTSLPIETVFLSNSRRSWRDPIKKNRIHFQYPEVWSNAIKNKPVIGIRNLFIAKAYYKPSLTIKYRLYHININEECIKDKEGEVFVNKFFDDSTLLKDLTVSMNHEFKKYITFDDVFTTENVFKDEQLNKIKQVSFLFAHYEYTKDHQLRFVINSPFNDLPDDVRTASNGKPAEGDKQAVPATVTNLYYITFSVEMNDDAKKLLGVLENPVRAETEPIYYTDSWDRNSCIVYSNIAEQTDYGYLGHTRKQVINPVKYYPVNSSSQSFWVDLYATCDHKTPVTLPPDDELFIEAQLL